MAHERSFDRLVNFSDAVVAIAITLLGLPLIDIASELGQNGIDTVGELLVENATRLFGFLLSFAVIALFWTGHHRVYDNLRGYTGTLVWTNMLWLASIVFLPFPTEIISTGHVEDRGAVALYIGTMIVCSASLVLQVVIARRHPELIEGDPSTFSLMPSTVVLLSLVAALVVALIFPDVNLWALWLILPAQIVSRRIQRRRGVEASV